MLAALGMKTRCPRVLSRGEITECLACGYSLQGVPCLAGQCPECGMTYEEDMIAWTQNPPTSWERCRHLVVVGLLASMSVLALPTLWTRHWIAAVALSFAVTCRRNT